MKKIFLLLSGFFVLFLLSSTQNVYADCNPVPYGLCVGQSTFSACTGFTVPPQGYTVKVTEHCDPNDSTVVSWYSCENLGQQPGVCENPANTPTPTLTRTPTPTVSPTPSTTVTTTPTGSSAGGTCSVNWDLSNSNPAPNTDVDVTVTGTDRGGWQGIDLLLDNQKLTNISIDQNGPTFKKTIKSGSAGKHTLKFTTDSGVTTCGTKEFTTGGSGAGSGSSPNALSCTVSGPTSVGRSEMAKITYKKGTNAVQSMDLYYTYPGQDLTKKESWTKAGDCDLDVLGSVPGGCEASIDTSSLPADKDKFLVHCNAYTWKLGNPKGVTLSPETGCTGNPRGSLPWSSCGANSSKEVALTAAPTSAATPTPSTKTSFYRVSTVKFESGASAPEWERYTDYPLRLPLNYSNAKAGEFLKVYVQFQSDGGQKSQVFEKSIKYIGPDPVISSVRCGYSPTGAGTDVVIEGENFRTKGSKSKLNFNGQEAKIHSWEQVASSSAWKVTASIADKLEGGQPIPLQVEVDDGRKIPEDHYETCTIGLTTLSFTAKQECRADVNMAADNIKVQVKESTSGAKPVFNEKISLNAEGQPVWTPPVLEVGKKYIMTVRGPKALGHKVEFEAEEGTSIIDEFRMLIGDIAPASSPDNRVNTLDYGVLLSQWALSKDVTAKSADFNDDKRVNSIDYSCLRQNFNKNGED